MNSLRVNVFDTFPFSLFNPTGYVIPEISGRDLFKGVGCNIPDVKKQLKLDHEASSSINIK
jgi:hypothetical protein